MTKKRGTKDYILIVPLGPRLVLRTSCKPLAALTFIRSASDLLRTSALGFNTLRDIFDLCLYVSNQLIMRENKNWEFDFCVEHSGSRTQVP